MYEYQTEFTKTCRMIANETRLKLLWVLFDKDLCVGDLANQTEISPQHASKVLSAMSAKGLISAQRKNRQVFYRPHLSGSQKQLIAALKKEKFKGTTFKMIIHFATAFTHERRIQIVRALSEPRTVNTLLNLTGMTTAAQTRHLRKLTRRGVVKMKDEKYILQKQISPFAKFLLSKAIR